ncbi:MAG: CDP-diacylglycerol--glycerol-3-phosphate 3-phosphatidyltransferase [Bacteriovoracaceae bacterium]|jgi:CDP-diacylglycerol--glycerol-3-phosphate 3-phosphatidyltransferase|nr:CDP-diacylglycerol--glycerol-3-phosphate 3-phosphatidyltransferase [Bacteriovoracaceae bacterium]
MENKNQNDLEIDNLPNRLTIFRVVLIPIIIGSLFLIGQDFEFLQNQESNLGWLAAWLFTLASITDFFDGYIARRKNIVTVFGSFIDPIADKFLTVSSLIMLMSLGRIPSLIVIILVLREMYMTSLRLLATNEGLTIPVNSLGKWKTAIQMVGIPMLMCNEVWWLFNFPLIGIILIYIASILSLWSAGTYSLGVIRSLKLNRQKKRALKKEKGISNESQPNSNNN